jgi:phage shock protein A
MRGVEKTARFSAIGLAAVFIVLSLGGIFGVWFVNRKAYDIALKTFGVIEVGMGIVDAGVGRVEELIATSRTEVQQAAETIRAIGGQAVANGPVLKALNERLETRLTPRIAQMREALAPVRDALGRVGNAVSMVSALPGMAERAPRLAALDDALDRIEGMSADTTQLRSTLKTLVTAQNRDVTTETIGILNNLTQRIDTRLGEVQSNVQAVRVEVKALQERVDKRKSRLLFAFNLTAMLVTLMLAWIVYTQVVVIQHHREKLSGESKVTCDM